MEFCIRFTVTAAKTQIINLFISIVYILNVFMHAWLKLILINQINLKVMHGIFQTLVLCMFSAVSYAVLKFMYFMLCFTSLDPRT